MFSTFLQSGRGFASGWVLCAVFAALLGASGCSESAPGCDKDADCRSGRICVARVCEDPGNNGVNNGNNGVNNGNNGVNNGNNGNNGVNNGNNGVECAVDGDCAADSFCDTDSAVCAEGCRIGECTGGFCDPDTRQCVLNPSCFGDEECTDSEYCAEGICTDGCREGGCDDGEECNLDTRQCAPIVCDGDGSCAPGEFCDPDGACREGCRVGGCADGQVCNVETRACEVLPCEADVDCGATQYCEPDAGVCLDGCREGGCGEGQVCDTDTRECQCEIDLGCLADSFCDEGQCREGCRVGGCSNGQVCDTDTRDCIDAPCGGDEECHLAEYCDDGACTPGCREGACGDGQLCDTDTRLCVDAPCDSDDACEADAWCDDGTCAPGCREGGCDEGFRCNLDDRQCELDLDEGPSLTVDPDTIEFGEVGQNVSAFRTLTLGNNGDEALVITRVGLAQNPSTGFQLIAPAALPIMLGPLETVTWRVRFEPTFLRNGEPTQYNNTVQIDTNDPQGRVNVAVSGTGVPDPEQCLRFDRRQVEFEFLPIGDIAAETVRLENCGADAIDVDGIEIEGDSVFTVTVGGNFPRALAPGASLSLVVNYVPDDYDGARASLVATAPDLRAESILLAAAASCPTAVIRGRVGDEGDFAQTTLRAVVGDNIDLRGDNSRDPAGGDLTYAWQVDVPDGSDPEWAPDLESMRLGFAPDVPGRYRVTLTTTSTLTNLEACEPAVFTVVVPLAVVELVWDNITDLDLHLVRSVDDEFGELGTGQNVNPDDCYFGNRNPDWGVEDDASDNPSYLVDDVNGFGPETILISGLEADRRYRVSARLAQRRNQNNTQVTVRVTVDGDTSEFVGNLSDQGEVYSPVIIEGDGALTPIE